MKTDPLLGMLRTVVVVKDLLLLLCGFGLLCWAALEVEAIVSGLKDMAVMSETIQQCSDHIGIAKDASTFAKAQIGDDNVQCAHRVCLGDGRAARHPMDLMGSN